MPDSLALIAPLAAVVSGAVAVVGLMITARVMTAKADLAERINVLNTKVEVLKNSVERLERDRDAAIHAKRIGDVS